MAKRHLTERRLRPLPLPFYDRPALEVSRDLLGKCLVRRDGPHRWVGRIVEVEAYIGESDPACHAFHGLTPRTSVMYGPAGHAYVYFTYGMHFMLNVVVQAEGFPAAVLIRALEPMFGFAPDDPRPASGPARLCKSMRIDRSLNGIPLTGTQLWIGQAQDTDGALSIRWSPRVGIRDGMDRLWRAYLFGNPYVSRKSDPMDPAEPTRAEIERRGERKTTGRCTEKRTEKTRKRNEPAGVGRTSGGSRRTK
jgi:DNA-3-methyladenine glycosylase